MFDSTFMSFDAECRISVHFIMLGRAMGITTTLVLVGSVVLMSFVIVARDSAERLFVKSLLLRLKPVLYSILSLLAFWWLVSRNFEPLGGLGDELMNKATYLSRGGGSPIDFIVAWLGAPIMGLVDIILMLAIVGTTIVFVKWGAVVLVTERRDLIRLFAIAGRRFWLWLLDLFIHPPSIKTIRETLRSGKPKAEQVRTISKALEEEYKKVMKGELPAHTIDTYARKHEAFAREMGAGKLRAVGRYAQGIAETAQSLRESAERMRRAPSEGERDEQR